MRRLSVWLGAVLLVVFAAIQVVPYGRNHTNSPVTQEPVWDRPETRALAARACFDCHSNETVWPWYSHIAPMSWLIQRDVDEGRRKLNFSEWDRPQEEAHESTASVKKNEMPPWFYALPATSAALAAAERETLITGLEGTFGSNRARAGDGRNRHDRRRP